MNHDEQVDPINYRDVPVSKVTGLQDLSLTELLVYPNPSSQDFTVVLPNGLQAGEFAIFDMQGRLVHSQDASNVLACSSLPAGTYLLEVKVLGEGTLHHLIVRK